MQAHTVERVESWDSRPFSGGFRELHDLADREFSGAVVTDAWLFMLNGRVVGVFEGDIEDFEDASGTVYEAPHPSLPLLFSMRERGGETQAKYYTNDTPLSEADGTLTDANFTGYVELSENVLSGDYYVVYYGGRSMSAAFVGASEELITGDEAFERADDEVGVYEVKKAPVNVTSIPEVEDEQEESGAGGAAAGAAGAAAGGAVGAAAGDDDTAGSTGDATAGAGAPDQRSQSSTDEQSAGSSDATEPTRTDASGAEDAKPQSERDDPAAESAASTGAGGADTVDESASPDATAGAESASTDAAADDGTTADATSDEPSVDRDRQSAGSSEASSSDAEPSDADPSDAASGSEREGEQDGVFDEEAEWRNARSVPTLDPEKSESTDGGAKAAKSSKQSRSQSSASEGSQKQSRSQSSTSKGAKKQSRSQSGSSRSQSGSSGKPRSTVEKLKQAVKQRNEKLEAAAARIDDLEDERDDLREQVTSLQEERESLKTERDELREERDELQARVRELEAEREADGADGDVDLSPEQALSGTNLFVRYDSKGEPTLDELDGDTDPAAVNSNLRIEHHTQFDAADATVDGEDFGSFLEASAAYRFVSWAVRDLPFEIRDAGHADGLADLYAAIPEVDRAELDGTVAVDTEEGSTSRTFDVVLRDRMGDPLVVAELNAAREPVTGDEMGDLVDAATAVREGADELSAAMYVTASFFEPAALETASEETGSGGFLSRSDRESFVKVGRKAGYHLCLVEDRNDAFHVTVPEL